MRSLAASDLLSLCAPNSGIFNVFEAFHQKLELDLTNLRIQRGEIAEHFVDNTVPVELLANMIEGQPSQLFIANLTIVDKEISWRRLPHTMSVI